MLDFYAQPGPMTSAGRYASMLAELPHDVAELVGIVQGLAIHEYVASDFYGFQIPDERRAESHIRSVEQMLERVLALDGRPLTVRRRRGFGSYFNPGFFEDHVVCEYWNAAQARWVFVDAQFDEVWRERLNIDHDILDVPRDRFLIAADAWVRCRSGEADGSKFGIFKGDLRGLWFIGDNLVHDVATLNKMKMLQWDTWGSMPRPGESLDESRLAFFDRLATLTWSPDTSLTELRRVYGEDGISVPATVYNAVLNRVEVVGLESSRPVGSYGP